MALSQSLPTPTTRELFLVVIKLAVGIPGFAFPVPTCPIAPEPLVPEVSAPLKLITVMEAATLCESVAVTFTLLSLLVAKARHISAVPLCTLVLTTRTQVRPAPLMPLTIVFGPDESVDTNASNNSLAELVEKFFVVIEVLDED